MRFRFINTLATVCTVVMGAAAAAFMIWMFLPTINVLDIHEVKLLQAEVHPGSKVEISLRYSKHHAIHGEITKTLIGVDNDYLFAMLDRTWGNLPCGDNMVAHTIAVIPATAMPGQYKTRMDLRYPSGRWRRYEEEHFDTPLFRIKAKPNLNPLRP